MAALLSPRTTLAILLGASEWPKIPNLAKGLPFARSAQELREYLLSPDGFGMPPGNLLDLFDSDKAVSELDQNIADFLAQHKGVAPQDLILYYVGHGGFLSDRDYFLALRSSVEGRDTSVWRMQDLASTIRTGAPELRRFVILDCCFAARAYQEFQSAPLTAAREKTIDAFPTRGTSLLCSSGPKDPSLAPVNAQYTMFTGAMLKVLRQGNPKFPPGLSLRDVGSMVEQVIKEAFPDTAVRPQVLSPNQDEGNIAELPLFPNLAVRTSKVEERLALQESRLESMERALIDLKNSLGDRATSVLEVQKYDAAADSMSGFFELTNREWESIPTETRVRMLRWPRARLTGQFWLLSAVALCCGFAIVLAAPNSSVSSEAGRQILFWLIVGVDLSSSLGWINRILERRRWASAEGIVEGDRQWQSLGPVLEFKSSTLYRLFGSFYVASPYLELATMICTVTLVWSAFRWRLIFGAS